jgi:DNA polymerase III subunit epsilon
VQRRTGAASSARGSNDCAEAGWYSDPWGAAELRWWDGIRWTGWTHPPAVLPAPEPEVVRTIPSADKAFVPERDPATAESVLANLLSQIDRIAVIDVETTGLYRTDRVVEIAIVTMDAATGIVIDEFDTIVNPLRDPGPAWIHGVTASMLIDAPPFEDIAHHVAARLHDAVVVGHNLRFDTRMVGNEFGRVGINVDWGIGLDTLRATGCKLGVACTEYGIVPDGAHRALHDARATGQLLLAVADAYSGTYLPVSATPLHHDFPRRVLTRDGFADVILDVPYLVDLARGVHADADVAADVNLLDRAVADLRLTADERVELAALAGELGLDERGRRRAHREFLDGLIDAALEDSIVTDTELDQLLRVATLLDIDIDVVSRRTSRYRAVQDTITLDAGLHVCFTGAALDELGNPVDRAAVLEPQARDRGLVTKDSCTKSCGLLIAADTASQSAKITAAHRFGIPVAALNDYLRALTSDEPLPVTRMMASPGVAQVCTECGDSWTTARRATTPICSNCRKPTRTKSTPATQRDPKPSPPAPPASKP